MHRLRIEYADAAPAYPRTLIWKQSSTNPAIRAAFGHFIGSGYQREVAFYLEVAPTIATRVPECFLAEHDEVTDEHVLLLEDLGPTHRPGDLLTGMKPEDASGLLRELALLHAARWRVVPSPDPAASESPKRFFEECLREYRPFLSAVVGEKTMGALDGFTDLIVPWGARLNDSPQTLIHADMHPGNALFPNDFGGRVVLVDWQGWRTGPAIRDVGRCLVLTLDTDERRRSEQRLVGEYCEALRDCGVEYGDDVAFVDYRIAAANQWIWAVTFARRQAVWDEATRTAMPGMIRRAAAAALEAVADVSLAS